MNSIGCKTNESLGFHSGYHENLNLGQIVGTFSYVFFEVLIIFTIKS